MVTEKMIEAAAACITGGSIFSHNDRLAMARAALEAALSTDAEPVAWYWEDATGCFHITLDRPDVAAMAKTVGCTPKPLYEAPPAPSVVVKALEEIKPHLLVYKVQDARSDEDEEIYEIGVREGYERAVQEIDIKTGGDGEYRYCTDHDPERHTPGPVEMIQRIVDRFETLNLIGEAEKRGDFWDVPGSAQVQDVAGLSAWQGWDQSRMPWSEAKHKDAVCYAAFGEAWSMNDAAALIGFIERTWTAAPAAKQEGKP